LVYKPTDNAVTHGPADLPDIAKRALLREDSAAPSVLDSSAHVEKLSRLHGDYLRALARRLCRNHHDPDDLVQDTFLKTLSSPIPEGANQRAWLARVMQNLFIDRIRRRTTRREDELGEVPAPAPETYDEPWWQSVTADDVIAVLDRLPDDQRAAFRMFALEGKSYSEIAQAQGIAKATVGTRILRARLRIREILAEERGDG
jgi:RNA polymerase sigma-70 factor, ECF subfamily